MSYHGEGIADATDVTYTPTTSGDWLTPPDDVAEAADELAGRVKAIEDAGGGGTGDYILIRDEKTQNTAGGTLTTATWNKRDLNTEVVDTGNHASISSSVISLAAGTYRCNIIVPAYSTNTCQARLQNTDDATTVLLGTSGYAGPGFASAYSYIVGRFTLAATKNLEVQMNVQSTRATDGGGIAANLTTEVYTVVELIRE